MGMHEKFFDYLHFGPMFLSYVAGIVLAIVFWRRCPVASILTLIAVIMLLLFTVVEYLAFDGPLDFLPDFFYDLGGFVNAAGFTLVLVAVFVGRRGDAPVNPYAYRPPYMDMPPPMAPPPPPPALNPPVATPKDNYGIRQ